MARFMKRILLLGVRSPARKTLSVERNVSGDTEMVPLQEIDTLELK